MEIERVDVRHAYELVGQKITTLALAPGALINAQQLAAELGVPLFAVEEALKLLAHEHLVRVTPRHGMYVSEVNVADLEQLSELRMELESLAAALAAERATSDDLAVLESLRETRIAASSGDLEQPKVAAELFELDRQFHQAIAQAAQNVYLTQTLEHFFGLSLRLWYLALPRLRFLPSAVEKHVGLVDAIRRKDAAAAEEIARGHVREFYLAVREELAETAIPEARREQ
jgi:GntR family transcriptional regulator, rspAB operon transcriptional repressor